MAWVRVLLVILWLVPWASHAGVSFPSSARVGSVGNIAIQCGDSEILKFSGGAWACSPDASGGASGSLLDLGDLGTNQSLSIAEIATTGDTNSIFTESAADKLLINVALPWPKADALTSDGANCAAGTAPLGVSTTGAVQSCFDVGTQVELDAVSAALAAHIATWGTSLLLDRGDDGANESTRISEIATTGDTNSIFTENLADKLLINVALAWPLANALAANGANCSAGFAPLGVDTLGAVEGCYNIATQAELDAALAGSGSILDLLDDGSDESTSIAEIATTGDTHSVFSEPSPNKLLITVSNAWPTATALAANGANCAAGSAPLGVDASGAVEGCYDVATQAELDASTAGSGAILDLGDDGGNDSLSIGEIAITGDTHSVFTESAADKLLINVANAWPKATALAANGANCAAGQAPLGVSTLGAVESCFDVATQTELNTHIANVISCASGICTVADAQELDMSGVSVTGVGEGLRLPGHATDCSTAGTEEGQVCWEADSDTLWIGNAAGVTQIGAGGGEGTITNVLSCTGPDCSSITVADGELLDFSAVNASSETEGIILPQGEGCLPTASGQVCWDTLNEILRIGNAEESRILYPDGDVSSVFGCEGGACVGVMALAVDDGINFSLADPTNGYGLIFPTRTDCSGAIPEGSACWDSDDDTLHVGTSAGVVSFGPGSAGDIESVFGCSSGACASIAVADTQLLSFAAVSVSSATEGLILPGHATDCSTAGTAEGQTCWEADSNTLWVGTDGGVVNISGTGVTLDQAFANGKLITGANSRSNAVFLGDTNGDGTLHFTGTEGPTQECVLDLGGPGEDTCDLKFNAAAGDSILLQQAGSTLMTVDDLGVAIALPIGDVFTVTINANAYQSISGTGVLFSIPSGDTFTANTPSFIIGNSAGTACLTLDPATGAVTQGANCANLNFSGSITSKIRHSANTAATVTLTGADCLGAIHKNTDADAIDFTLCAGVTGGGQMVCFEDRAGGIITVDVAGVGETISLSNGTSVGAGDAIDLAAGIGNGFCMMSDSATAWHVLPGAIGTITDGGVD